MVSAGCPYNGRDTGIRQKLIAHELHHSLHTIFLWSNVRMDSNELLVVPGILSALLILTYLKQIP